MHGTNANSRDPYLESVSIEALYAVESDSFFGWHATTSSLRQILRQRIVVMYEMSPHPCLANCLGEQWAVLQAKWATRRLLQDILLIGVDEVDRIQDTIALRLFADPVGSRLLQGQWWIDLERAQGELVNHERDLMRIMRSFYITLNLNAPVDVTGY